jgi:hypothetical protein
MFISVEVFNLLQVDNTVSYTWVTDVTNRQYAVPNYLTRRTLEFKIAGEVLIYKVFNTSITFVNISSVKSKCVTKRMVCLPKAANLIS